MLMTLLRSGLRYCERPWMPNLQELASESEAAAMARRAQCYAMYEYTQRGGHTPGGEERCQLQALKGLHSGTWVAARRHTSRLQENDPAARVH